MSSSTTRTLHRRKSSRDDESSGISLTITEPPEPDHNGPQLDLLQQPESPRKPKMSAPEPPSPGSLASHVPQRQRVLSTPSQPMQSAMYSPAVTSAGPHRTTFGHLPPPPAGQRQLRNSFSHARSPSASSYNFYPPAPSPLSSSFSFPNVPAPGLAPASPTSPDSGSGTVPSSPVATRPAPAPPRRHSRIHSRNLSIYFPRPGSGAPASIAEDGGQEVEVQEVPEMIIPSMNSAPLQQGRELSAGFTFGRKKPASATATEHILSNGNAENGHAHSESMQSNKNRPNRRGHHHKHSLSHNFFSFMEPEASTPSSFTTGAPTPTPTSSTFPSSPWQPMTPMTNAHSTTTVPSPATSLTPLPSQPLLTTPATLAAIGQFCLGALLWVRGQQCGSLACTGLGYWVVFDAVGVACEKVVPVYLRSVGRKEYAYGNARLETLAIFAQSVYLIFAAVYVCKEALEHMLLSHGEGHHHHRGDEFVEQGIDMPIFPIILAVITILGTSISFENNARIVNATSNRLPSIPAFFYSIRYPHRSSISRIEAPPSTVLGKTLSNPYTVVPVVSALSLLGLWGLIDGPQHRAADLLLASALALFTFSVAYPAALALGKVLLQTAPARGMVGGRMEAFLRAMRDLERHPQILHLPPPHVWQVTPSTSALTATSISSTSSPSPSIMIATLELHIRRDLDDESVLKLTKWAWERCMGALAGNTGGKESAMDGGAAEVTVGIVRD